MAEHCLPQKMKTFKGNLGRKQRKFRRRRQVIAFTHRWRVIRRWRFWTRGVPKIFKNNQTVFVARTCPLRSTVIHRGFRMRPLPPVMHNRILGIDWCRLRPTPKTPLETSEGRPKTISCGSNLSKRDRIQPDKRKIPTTYSFLPLGTCKIGFDRCYAFYRLHPRS